MNASDTSSTSSPSQAGSKVLSKFADVESLFVRSEPVAPPKPQPTAIPLVRFQQLEQAIRNSPAVVGPYEELGRIYLESERWVDARRVLEAGIKNCPEHEPVVQMHEDLMLLQASHLVEVAKRENAEEPGEQSRYGLEQAEINLLNERIRVCRDRFSRHPDQKEILITWAIALRQSKRHQEAIDLLKDAATDLSLRSRASLQLGMCFQSLNRPLDALSYFRRASLFRSPPPDTKVAATALELAAKLAEEVGLVDSAIYYLTELAPLVPNSRKLVEQEIERLKPLLPPSPDT